MAENDRSKGKKQILLRLSPTLYNDIYAWAEEDFRSINGQIEYLLAECLKARKKGVKKTRYEQGDPDALEELKALISQDGGDR